MIHCYYVYGRDYVSGSWVMSLSHAKITLFAH